MDAPQGGHALARTHEERVRIMTGTLGVEMNRYALLIALVFGLAACADEAVQGTEAADNCNEVQCPAGTSPVLQSEAESACGGSADVDRGMTDLGVSASAQCFGSGSCSLICDPPAPCCGGEEWTDTSYKCDTPCAASCSCSGKCGTVTGADCEAVCGDCSGGQVCSADNVCLDECPEGAEVCGDECFFPVDGDVCFNGEVCEAAKNCEGKACGSDDCGDICGECLGSESCDNGQCVSDCKGSLPVCQGEVIQACQSTNPDDADAGWAWQDELDCDSPGTDTPYCAELASGATCVECNDGSDDQCGVGKACDLENGVCIDTCVPDCNNADGAKRYCGGDGCGGFCEDVDYSCNGNGNWCNPENGKCDTPLEECTFSIQDQSNSDGSGVWLTVIIPYGNPFCNSVVPGLGIILDDELPPEAVVSGHVEMGTPDANGNIGEAFDNVCTWTIHEFDSGNKTKCGEQLCSMLEIPKDQNPIEFIKNTKLSEESFCCKETSTCEDYGLLGGQQFCNVPEHPAYQEFEVSVWCAGPNPKPIAEGTLLRCNNEGPVAEFKCEACDNEGNSDCLLDGWGCFTTLWEGCDGGDGNCGGDGPDLPEGTEMGSCQEDQSSWCETEYMAQCIAEDEGISLAYSTCSYDPVSNQPTEDWDEGIGCEDGTVCVDQVYTDEEKPPCENDGGAECTPEPDEEGPWWWKQVPATCQVSELCSNGALQEQFCNTVDHPDYDPAFSETQRLMCEVQNGAKIVKDIYGNDDGGGDSSDCALNNDDPYGEPMLCKAGYGDEGNSWTQCVPDESKWCDMGLSPDAGGYFDAAVCGGGQPSDVTYYTTCEYDEATNTAVLTDVNCGDQEVCVQWQTSCPNSDTPNIGECGDKIAVGPHCAAKKKCPDLPGWAVGNIGASDFLWCNTEGQPGYDANGGSQQVNRCDYEWETNFPKWTLADACDGQHQVCVPGGPNPENGSAVSPGCQNEVACAETSECLDEGLAPAGAGGLGVQDCSVDPSTNYLVTTNETCLAGEACYYNDGNDAWTDAGPTVGWKAMCVDRACGVSGANGQPGCWELEDECHLPSAPGPDPTGVFEAEAFAHFVETGVGPMPTYACLPSDSCPTGGKVLEYTWPEGGDIKTSWLIANSDQWYQHFGTAESDEEIGFVFVCRLMDDGSVVYPNNQETVFVPTADYIALPPYGGPGEFSTKPCGTTGTESETDSIKCCACAYLDAPDVKMNGDDAAVQLAWCTSNCNKAQDDQKEDQDGN